MKILLTGDFFFRIYQDIVSETLRDLGHQVIDFRYKDYIKRDLISRFENKYTVIGPKAISMNKALRDVAIHEKPDIILLWRATLIIPDTIKFLKKQCRILVSYNNDDPFGNQYLNGTLSRKRLWKYFIKSIPLFDINFVYRPSNIDQYNKAGSKNTKLFLPYFIAEEVNSIGDVDKIYDVIFIGHNEADRYDYIKYLIEMGINIKVVGTFWPDDVVNSEHFLATSVRDKDYYELLKKSKISLAFFSKLNQDVYTRRCFEIPAAGNVMLSETSKEIKELFEEGKEAFYFSTKEEMLALIRQILADEKLQEDVGSAAKKRSEQSGYDVVSRTAKMINEVVLLMEQEPEIHLREA